VRLCEAPTVNADELLRLYEAGRRDFRGENLRGQCFKGKDLSGADFSGADIRSTNFIHAILKESNFSQAKAGLQKRWTIFLMALSLLLSGISGFFSGVVGYLIALIFDSSSFDNQLSGWVSLVVLSIIVAVILRRGITAGAVAVAVAVAVAFAVAVAVAGAGAVAVAGAFTGAFAVAVAVAGAGAFAGTVAFAFAVAVAVAVAGAGAVAVAVAGAGAGAGAVVLTLVSAYIGWRALKGDARDDWVQSVAVAFAAVGGTSFRGADLTDANFTQAQLKSTDLRRATLMRTNWHQAKKLDRARVADTILLDPTVRDLLVTHRGQGKSYARCNLQGANLVGADLSDANLKEADISQATLEGAWLERANLTKTQALGTNFHQTTLTGACLESWNIDSTTQLDGAICDYVYLLKHQQERRPNSGIFEPGEFTKLFEEVLDTIDLIFRNGLDWKAFVAAFGNVRVEHGDAELDIQSIENKGDGVMVVKLQASPDADNDTIHQSMMTEYDLALKAIEENYRAQLQAKDSQIDRYRQENTNLWEMTKLMASRPITVETKAVVEKDTNTTNLNVENIAGAINTGSGTANASDFSQTITTPASQQTLAEAAADIQVLLKQLEQTAPSESMSEKMALASTAIAQIESDPTLKQRVIAALSAGGIKAFEAAIDHPVAAFVVGAIEGWKAS